MRAHFDVECPWCDEETHAEGEIYGVSAFYFTCDECLSDVVIDLWKD